MSRRPNTLDIADWIASRGFPGREPRVHVNMPASVQVATDRSVTARIIDLSLNGFRLTSQEPLEVGQLVELASFKDAVQGQIRWVDGLDAGGVFTEPTRIVA